MPANFFRQHMSRSQQISPPGRYCRLQLEVHSEHVFFAGEDGLLVHNMCETEKAVKAAEDAVATVDEPVTLFKASQREIGGMTEFETGYIGRWFAKDGWISKAYAHPNIGTHEDFASVLIFKKADYDKYLKQFETRYVGSDYKGVVRQGIELEIPRDAMKLFNDLIVDKKTIPWHRLPDFGG